MKHHQYDLAFGIGAACSCSQSLRRAGLQFLSFPGDWLTTQWGNPYPADDFVRRARRLCDGFEGFFRPEDFQFRPVENHDKRVYVNVATNYILNHDFPLDRTFDDALPSVIEKYTRRRDRLLSLIRASRRVLVVRLDLPDGYCPTPLEDCSRVRRLLSEAFPGVAFDVLLLQCVPGRPFAERTVETFAEGCFRIAFDCRQRGEHAAARIPDLDLTTAAVKGFARVRDYRTRSERAAYRLSQEKKRWARFGATSRLAYARNKGCASLRKRFASLQIAFHRLALRRARRTFDHILPLGINCEVAFHFYRRWGFVDSSLFAWSLVYHLEHLAGTLAHFDSLFAGEVELVPRSMMWKCLNDGMCIHGKLKPGAPGAPLPGEKTLAADKADTLGRVRHLKEKFLRTVRDDQSTLFVHRLCEKDANAENLDARLTALEQAIDDLGARNWTLLVVCERPFLSRMPSGPHRLFRAVRKFNDPRCVTDDHTGDPVGWDAIFTEFAPAKILPKAHGFKFE